LFSDLLLQKEVHLLEEGICSEIYDIGI